MNYATLSEQEYKGFSRLVFDLAGIHMSEAKKPLISGRLAKRLGQHGLGSYGDYLALVLKDQKERQIALDLLTTNETYFFREPQHFDFLAQEVLPSLRQERKVRVWSAACSSGEEPYTLAMVLAESLGHSRFEILASDISTRVLAQARQALYPIEDAANIPKAYKIRHCLKGVGSQEGRFLVSQALRERVDVAQINLNERLPDVGQFDVIFLRNVMIYFSVETKQGVMARLIQQLKPGGYFFISHSESLHGVTTELETVRPSIYRKPVF